MERSDRKPMTWKELVRRRTTKKGPIMDIDNNRRPYLSTKRKKNHYYPLQNEWWNLKRAMPTYM